MRFLRSIGASLRGSGTPLQVMLATVCGACFGFVPGSFLPADIVGGLAQAPGLLLALLCVALIASTNLLLFTVALVLAKVLGLVMLPVCYAIGVWLLDGPLSGLFAALIDSKGTAWFGLEYYATAGSLVPGLLFGVLFGALINRATARMCRHVRNGDAEGGGLSRHSRKLSVRLLGWVLFGGRAEQGWQRLAHGGFRMPVRLSGTVIAALLVSGVVVFQSWFSTPLLTDGVQAGLQVMNGATVDLRRAELALFGGTLRIDGLAIADSKALDKDLLAADAMVATIDTGELLRRRFVIDELRVSNARAGGPRTTRGVAVPSDEPAAEPEPAPTGAKTIDDYLADFELWRERLVQAQQWLEEVFGGEEPATTPEDIERQRREQEQLGLANVRALHLLPDAPMVVIRRVDIEGIPLSIDGAKDSFDLRLRNLSDAPSLLADVASLSLKTHSDSLMLQLTGPVAGGDALSFDFAAKGLPVDKLFAQLKLDGKPALSGGTIDFGGQGKLSGLSSALRVDLPLDVQIRGSTFALGNQPPTKIDQLRLPLGLTGSWTDPAVSLDDEALQQALLAAGQKELANYVQAQAGKLLGGALPVDLDQAPDKIVDDAQKKAEDEAKKAADKAAADARKKLEDEAKKRLPGGLNGLLPGGKKN